jgi:hypothetical protein
MNGTANVRSLGSWDTLPFARTQRVPRRDNPLAIEYFEAVIRINPKLPDAWSGRAAVKKVPGDPGAEADSLKARQLGKAA